MVIFLIYNGILVISIYYERQYRFVSCASLCVGTITFMFQITSFTKKDLHVIIDCSVLDSLFRVIQVYERRFCQRIEGGTWNKTSHIEPSSNHHVDIVNSEYQNSR